MAKNQKICYNSTQSYCIYMDSKELKIYIGLILSAIATGVLISYLGIKSVSSPAPRVEPLPGFSTTGTPTPPPRTIPPTPTPSNRPSATPTGTPASANLILHNVPFTAQAPNGEWDNKMLANGCEEASVYMAISWAKGTPITAASARQEILAISNYEQNNHGVWLDTSTEDTFNWIVKDYYGYNNATLKYDITVADIVNELKNGRLVIVPVNGQIIGNPYYTPPGPLRHKLVIKGYDPDTREFITNDPGTRMGNSMRFSESALYNAIWDYRTGDDLPLPPQRRAMISIGK